MESKHFDRTPDQSSSRVTNETSREELERLLTLAEKLEEKRNFSANYESLFQFVNIFVWVAPLIFIGLAVLHSIKNSSYVPDYIKTGIWMLLPLALTWLFTLRTWRKRISMQAFRDQVALEDIVELLREVQPLIAQREGWSALDKAAFRIRIKRFDIAPNCSLKPDDASTTTQEQNSNFTMSAPPELRSSVETVQNPPTVTLQNR